MTATKIRAPLPTRFSALRMLFVALVFASVTGGISLLEPIEVPLREMTTNQFLPKYSSGQVVVVTIDKRILEPTGSPPMNGTLQAKLIDAIGSGNPKQIGVAWIFAKQTSAQDTKALQQSLARQSPKVFSSVRLDIDRDYGWGFDRSATISEGPAPEFANLTKVGSLHAWKSMGTLRSIHNSMDVGGRTIQGFAAALAGMPIRFSEDILADPRVDIDSIPNFNAVDVLNGNVPKDALRNKIVLIGYDYAELRTIRVRRNTFISDVFVQAYSIEMFLHGSMIDLGWIPLLGVALVIAALQLFQGPFARSKPYLVRSFILIYGLALVLGWFGYRTEPGSAGLFLLVISILSRVQRARDLGRLMGNTIDEETGLARLSTISASAAAGRQIVVYAIMRDVTDNQGAADVGALGSASRVSQLATVWLGPAIYIGDLRQLVWLESLHTDILGRIDQSMSALQDLLGEQLHFGVDTQTGTPFQTRLRNVLAAAEAAKAENIQMRNSRPDASAQPSTEWWNTSPVGEIVISFVRATEMDFVTGRPIGLSICPVLETAAAGRAVLSHADVARCSIPLTTTVFEASLANAIAATRLKPANVDSWQVSIPVSAKLLQRPNFVEEVRSRLNAMDADPTSLRFDVDPVDVRVRGEAALRCIRSLRNLGIGITAAELGIHDGRFEDLRSFPATELKLAYRFRDTAIAENRALISAASILAETLGRGFIVPGVFDLREAQDRHLGAEQPSVETDRS